MATVSAVLLCNTTWLKPAEDDSQSALLARRAREQPNYKYATDNNNDNLFGNAIHSENLSKSSQPHCPCAVPADAKEPQWPLLLSEYGMGVPETWRAT